MKKLLSVSILCAAIFCGCSAKDGEKISETSASEISSAAVTAEITAETAAEKTEEILIQPPEPEKEILLSRIKSAESFEVMYCGISKPAVKIDDEIIKWWDSDSNKSSEVADEITRKFCGFWSSAYRAET